MGVARPFIRLAAKFLGPGPTRLKLVKLAHDMGGVAVFAAGNGYAEKEGGLAGAPKRAA